MSEVSIWSAGIDYQKYDIVVENSSSTDFYYAQTDHTSGTESSSGSPGSAGYEGTFPNDKYRWGGIVNINGVNLPHFIWKPSYGTTVDIEAKVKENSFGDGYKQIIRTDIDNIQLVINLSFEKRSDKEAFAIIHFLENRMGYKPFVFIPTGPYGTNSISYSKRFICRGWTNNYNFVNNNSISAIFEEIPRLSLR